MKTKIENLKTVLIVVLILLVVGNAFWVQNLKADLNETTALYEATQDELVSWKNKDGENVARIAVLETRDAEMFTSMHTQDSLIKELQTLVKDYGKQLKKQGSATIIKTETKYDTVYVKLDAEPINIFPGSRIMDSINNKWIHSRFGFRVSSVEGNYISVDTTYYSLNVKNDYSLVIGKEKTGFLGLGKPKLFAEITNHNPYTETTALRTYQVSQEKTELGVGIGPAIGYGFGTKGADWFVGFVAQYSLFKF